MPFKDRLNLPVDATGRMIRDDDNQKVKKWKYHATGSKTCEACMQYDGKIFNSLEEAPKLPIHPNCKCWLEEIHVEDNLVDVEKVLKDVFNASEDLKLSENNLKEIKIKKNINHKYSDAIDNVLIKTSKWDNAIGDFTKHYYDLVKGNRTDDKGAHYDANYEASSRGSISGEAVTRIINWGHEVLTGVYNVVAEGKDIISVIKDAFKDMDINEKGIRDGRKNRK